MIGPNVLLTAANISKSAGDAVLHSFAILKLMQAIPSTASPAGRKKQAAELRKEFGWRVRRLCDPLQARLAALEKGDAFTAVNFEGLRAEGESTDLDGGCT